nr:RNA-dependent RNA polymerase [Mononegavirales sp.]
MRESFHAAMKNLDSKFSCRSELQCFVCKYLTQYTRSDPLMVAELMGIYRHWGHPTVNVRGGCYEVREIARRSKVFNERTLNQISGWFKRFFILSFIKKNGHWPKCFVPEIWKDTMIYKIWRAKKVDISDYQEGVEPETWDYIVLEKNFEFDYSEDWSLLLEDRAVSFPRDKWDCTFDPVLLGYKPPECETSKRLIIQALSTFKINIEDICNTIMWGEVPYNWKIVTVHSKEREMKSAPRLFAMLVMEMRLYFCVTEMNLANQIMDFFPQTTMTMGELDLTQRLLLLTRPASGTKAHVPVYVNIDYEKWNLQWRYESTYRIFRSIDHLFGTPGLYEYTHKFFAESMILVGHRDLPPGTKEEERHDPPEGPLIWYDHEGGFEGLRQKAWTLSTSCALMEVSYRSGVYVLITGQGDNQVLKVFVPKEDLSLSDREYLTKHGQKVQDAIHLVMRHLEEVSSEIGLPVKPSETWISSCVFAYGKEIIINGAFAPAALKRFCRAYYDVGEVFPTMDNKLATIHTAGQTAAQKGDHPLLAYFLSLFESRVQVYLSLTRTNEFGVVLMSSRLYTQAFIFDFVCYITLLPRALGGYPAGTILSYMYRGHPDPLTEALNAVQLLAQRSPVMKKALAYSLRDKKFKEKVDETMLIQDPTSVNWDLPVLPANILKNSLAKAIETLTVNEDLKVLFHQKWVQEDQEIKRALIQAEPLMVRVINDVYTRTPAGARLGFIAMFSNTRTAQMLVNTATGGELLNKVKSAERHMLTYQIREFKKVQLSSVHHEAVCLSEAAQELRDRSWSTPTSTLKIEGVTVPHPVEQFQYGLWLGQVECTTPYCLIRYSAPKDGSAPWASRGEQHAYLGSRTREKKIGKLIPLERTTPAMAAAQRLCMVQEWAFSEDETTQETLRTIIQCRTNCSIERLKASGGTVYGGSVTHRYQDPMTSHNVLSNTRPNLASHLYLSSDSLGQFARGVQDVTIHFQGMFLCGMTLLHVNLTQSHTDEDLAMHGHVRCLPCVRDIVEEKVKLPKVDLDPSKYRKCLLLYTEVGEGKNLNVINESEILRQAVVSASNYKEMEPLAAATLLWEDYRRAISSSYRGSSDLSVTSGGRGIDLLEFLSVTVQRIVEGLAVYFILGECDRILDKIGVDGLTLESAIRTVIFEHPHGLWGSVRDHVLLPEMRDTLLELDDSPVASSEAYKGGPVMDIVLCRILARQCLQTVRTMCVTRRNVLLDRIFFVTSRHSEELLLRFWINSQVWWIVCTGAHPELIHEVRSSGTECLSAPDPTRQLALWFDEAIVSSLIFLGVEEIERSPLKFTLVPCETVLRASRQRMKDGQVQEESMSSLGTSSIDQGHSLEDLDGEIFFKSEIQSRTTFQASRPSITSVYQEEPPAKASKSREDHQYRLVGLYSTAPYKYLEIFSYLGLRKGGIAATLAEGSGGVARLLLDLYEYREVHFNTLYIPGDFTPHRMVGHVPAEVLRSPNKERCLSTDISLQLGGDLLSQTVIQALDARLPSRMQIITVDAEISGDPTPDKGGVLCDHSVYLASRHLHRTEGILVFKTFCRFPDLLASELATIAPCFEKVEVLVPVSSSHQSNEVFIVARKVVYKRKVLQGERYSSDYLSWISFCARLKDSRHDPCPFQSYQPDRWMRLHVTLSKYLESNDRTSLIILLGDVWGGSTEEVPSLTALRTHIKTLESMIYTQMDALGSLSDGATLSASGRAMLSAYSADRFPLERAAGYAVNSHLLIELIQGVIDSETTLTKRLSRKRLLTHKEHKLWVTFTDPEDWNRHYGRAFHHMIGHWKRRWILQQTSGIPTIQKRAMCSRSQPSQTYREKRYRSGKI